MNLSPDFRDLLEELGRAKVEYVLVGGYAVAFHGRPRATKDIDLVLKGTAENLERAATALDAFGAPPQVVQATRSMRSDEVVYMGQPPMRVDFLQTIDGVDARELFRDAVEAEVDGLPIRVISIDHLIRNKRAAGRPVDLLDADFLERVRDRRA